MRGAGDRFLLWLRQATIPIEVRHNSQAHLAMIDQQPDDEIARSLCGREGTVVAHPSLDWCSRCKREARTAYEQQEGRRWTART